MKDRSFRALVLCARGNFRSGIVKFSRWIPADREDLCGAEHNTAATGNVTTVKTLEIRHLRHPP